MAKITAISNQKKKNKVVKTSIKNKVTQQDKIEAPPENTALKKSAFMIAWEKGNTIEEARAHTLAFIKTLPWREDQLTQKNKEDIATIKKIKKSKDKIQVLTDIAVLQKSPFQIECEEAHSIEFAKQHTLNMLRNLPWKK